MERIMGKARNMRPQVVESLEERTVMNAAVVPDMVSHVLVLQKNVLNKIRADFHTFRSTYAKDGKTVLIAKSDGSADPAKNRAAFDALVEVGLNTLSANIANSLETVPNSAVLADSIDELLVGDEPGTLQSNLADIKTPSAPKGTVLSAFRVKSWVVVSASQSLVNADVLSFLSGHGTI
jgi:uncharacterized lipoprotein YddW (UPF0748 family)